MNQPDFFPGAPPAQSVYVPEPRHVRNRLAGMVQEMQAAEYWPWEPVMVTLYRGTVWPYLYERLPDPDEAQHWSALIEAQIARLDAAAA